MFLSSSFLLSASHARASTRGDVERDLAVDANTARVVVVVRAFVRSFVR